MSENSRDNMAGKCAASLKSVADFESCAQTEEKFDRKLAEHTRKVAAAHRARAAYIKSRLGG